MFKLCQLLALDVIQAWLNVCCSAKTRQSLCSRCDTSMVIFLKLLFPNKVKVLQKYSHPSIKALMIWNFDETVISLLPPGEVPYATNLEDETATGTLSEKINDAVSKMGELRTTSLGSQDQGKASIRKEFTKFYNFIKGGNDGLSSLRRETMFINVLQGLHPLEAEILILVKDKDLESKYKIPKAVVSQAFPDIQWGGRS
mgnify:CR=1 FL=1